MEGAEQKVTIYHLVSHEAHEVGELILDRIRCLGEKQHLSQPEIKQLRTVGVELRRPELKPRDRST
jgi:DNA-binding transcriptional regulator YiaG